MPRDKRNRRNPDSLSLGTGLAENARRELRDRDRMIERTMDKALGNPMDKPKRRRKRD